MKSRRRGKLDLYLFASFLLLPVLAWKIVAIPVVIGLAIFAFWMVAQPGDVWDNALAALTLLLVVMSGIAIKILMIAWFSTSLGVAWLAAGVYCLIAARIILEPKKR